MGNYEQLKTAISDVIKTNGNQEINGDILQNTLLNIISTIGVNYTFAGVATPITNPGTPDQNVFYLASEPGVYVNFGGVELKDQIFIFTNKNGNWEKIDTGIPTKESRINENDFHSNKFEIDENNLLNSIYKRTELYRAIESKLSNINSVKHIYPTDVPINYPNFLWGKKQFFFDKDLGEAVQIKAQREIRIREVSNISFSAWLYFEKSVGLEKNINMIFSLGKQYPVGINFNETLFRISVSNTRDYSAASFDSPLMYSISNEVIGNINYYIDQEIKYDSGEKFVHVRFDKEIPIRYGNLYFHCDCGYILANNKLRVSLAVIDPILTTTDIYDYEKDYSAYNYGYSLAIGDFKVQGVKGRVTESAVKTPCKIYTGSDLNPILTVIDNKDSVDLELSAESLIEPNYKDSFILSSGYYYPLFESTKKFYIQFGIKIEEVAQILYLEKSDRSHVVL